MKVIWKSLHILTNFDNYFSNFGSIDISILPFPQDRVWPGESNSGMTLIPLSLACEITLCTSVCV